MNPSLSSLAERIRGELKELERVTERLQTAWQRAGITGDDFYLDSVALNLHGFYSGIERILERCAETLDGSLPKGENWHQALLLQMSKDLHGIRPAVISLDSCHRLDEYCGFRHIVRNVYAYHFDPVKLEKLVRDATPVFSQARAELFAFANFLDPV